jgi:D-aminopeptidase
LGIRIGTLPTGRWNAITDVHGVGVGHSTLIRGENVRTGVTVIVPCLGENTFQLKVPAAVHTGNGFGKAAGFTQVMELGNLESPLALTNTLSVGTVLEAMVRLNLDLPGNEQLRSVNVVVGETNDGWLSDIRGQHVRAEHVRSAWEAVASGPVTEGCVGAGTGTVCFGFKGGIGSSSRVAGPWTVGVLLQTNFGGSLRIDGRPMPDEAPAVREDEDGSCMIVVATDAPLDARLLGRLARRALLGLGRAGSVMSSGSGDYVIAFSTSAGNRVLAGAEGPQQRTVLPDREMTPLFQAVIEATEEAILNSLLAAVTTTGRSGHTARAIDPDAVRRAVER